MRLVALLLLAPSLAFGQGLTTKAPGRAGQTRTNFALQSQTISSGTAFVSPWAQATATVTTSGTRSTITSSNSVGMAYQSVTFPATTQIVASVKMAKSSGTGTAAVALKCGVGAGPSACTCVRSDGGSCTAAIGGQSATNCTATVTDLGVNEIRVSAIATCFTTETSTYIVLQPGAYGSATGTTVFTEAMVETGVTKPSKYCATVAAAKTCKD